MGALQSLAEEAYDDGYRWFPNVRQDLQYNAVALSGEVGEFCNVVKKIMRDGPSEFLTDCARQELTDVLVYLLHTVVVLDMNIEEWYARIRERNEHRFGNGRPTATVE